MYNEPLTKRYLPVTEGQCSGYVLHSPDYDPITGVWPPGTWVPISAPFFCEEDSKLNMGLYGGMISTKRRGRLFRANPTVPKYTVDNDCLHIRTMPWGGYEGPMSDYDTTKAFTSQGQYVPGAWMHQYGTGETLTTLYPVSNYLKPWLKGQQYEDWYYSKFQDGSLIRDLPIDHRLKVNDEPYGADYSVWYLARDMYDIIKMFSNPKLLAKARLARSSSSFSSKFGNAYDKVRRWWRGVQQGANASQRELSSKQSSELKALRELANAYLGEKFGFEATYRDLLESYNVAGELAQALTGLNEELDPRRRRFKTQTVSGTLGLTSRTFSTYNGWPNVYGVISASDKINWTCRRKLRYHFSQPEVATWAARLAQLLDVEGKALGQFNDMLGLSNPAAAWDLVPFSFVVDWFINVSDWLSRHPFPRALDYTLTIDSYQVSARGTINIPYRTATGVGLGGTSSLVYCRQSFTPEELDVEINYRGKGITPQRAVISAALIGQRLIR